MNGKSIVTGTEVLAALILRVRYAKPLASADFRLFERWTGTDDPQALAQECEMPLDELEDRIRHIAIAVVLATPFGDVLDLFDERTFLTIHTAYRRALKMEKEILCGAAEDSPTPRMRREIMNCLPRALALLRVE